MRYADVVEDDPSLVASRLQLPAHSGDRLARDDPGRDEIASEVHRLHLDDLMIGAEGPHTTRDLRHGIGVGPAQQGHVLSRCGRDQGGGHR